MTIHGSGQPKIILNYGEGGERTILLPYCDNLIETFTPEIYQQRLYNGTISSRILGWWYSVVLDYSKYLSQTDLTELNNGTAKLFTTSDRTIRLYPFNSSVYYNVELDAENSLIFMHRPFNEGHAGIKLAFVGTTRITTIDLSTLS